MRSRVWLPMAFAAFVALVLLASPAGAERAQEGDLIVSLDGGITPRKLPRDHTVPVAIRLGGGVETVNAAPLPRLKEIKFELAWRGTLFTRGLPVCPRSRLRDVDSRQAIAACGGALVGSGHLKARVFLPSQSPFGIHSRLLAFNGRTKQGRTAVWVQAYTGDPPTSFILPFHVRRQPGRFRTVLYTVVPRSVGPWPRFTDFQITISRRFSYRGKRRSYISASCPIPSVLSAGFLSFARGTFDFADGRQLTTESVRGCRAREGALTGG